MEKSSKAILTLFLLLLNRIIKTVFIVPRGTCRFYPSCSEYAKTAIENLPLHKAIFYIVKRLVRCNPFVKPGYDPVPQNIERRNCCE